ncbi:MAG: alpha-L-fucosidase [Bryobacteraceae bacterium]
MKPAFRKTAALFGAAMLFVSALSAQTPDPARERRLQWWREARFGMFIHWGLYAVPAGEWKGKPIAGIGEWIMNRARIPVAEYEQLARQFNPVKFNAEEWVQLARDAGMKYLVITSKHHDGFAMYGSKVSRYNIVDATPFRRDPMKELAAACRKAGIRLCFYYSHAQDWHERDGAGNNWDFPPNEQKNFAKYYEEKAKPQVRELLTQYGPIGLIWFDTPQLVTKEQAVDIAALVHKLQPECIVSGRVGHDAGDYDSAGDNQITVGVVKRDWETPVTMNDTWGFKKDDHNWKSVPVLIKQLVRIASRGGNYLLNVGPTAEGVIPQPSVERLRAVGKWIRVNSEAINGTSPSPFPYNQDWGLITVKPGKLYLHVFEWPGSKLSVYGIRNKVRRAYLLADAARKPLGVKQASDAKLEFHSAEIRLPAAAPDPNDSVIVMEIAGAPDVVTAITQQPGGAITLDAYLAAMHKGQGSTLAIDRRGVLSGWTDAKDWLSWDFKVFRPGAFDIVAVTAPPARGAEWDGGHRLAIHLAGKSVQAVMSRDGEQVDPSNPHTKYVVSRLGRIAIDKPGDCRLELRPESLQTARRGGLTLAYIKLAPAN